MTVVFDSIEPDVFGHYLCDKRKINGSLLKPQGIPPHTALLAGNEEIKSLIKGLLPEIEKFMDDRCMAGNLSETRMRAIVQTQQFDLRKEIEEIKTLLTKQAQAATESSNKERAGANDEWNRWVVVGGFFRRIPFDWVFPSGPVLNVYQYWHHGDENKKISPRKKSKRPDLSWCKNEKKQYMKNLEECSFIFKKLDAEAKRKGLMPRMPTRDQTIATYYASKHVMGVAEVTPTGRKRNWAKLAWGTVVRHCSYKKRKNNWE
jgi:hypothetical protein